MRRVALVCLLWPLSLAAAAPASASPAWLKGDASEVIVRFEPGTVAAARLAAREAAGVEFDRGLQLPGAQVVSTGGSLSRALSRLERLPEVAYAQPNYRYRALAAAPDDTLFGRLWGLRANPGADVLPAWDATRGAGQVIAVVDSGVDLTHPDLAGNLWTNPGELAGDGVDGDRNGRTDDVHGFDFVDGDADPDDFQFHGTHVAGTAAARAGNRLGVAGVAPEARIMAVRALDGDGSGSSAEVGNAVAYAAREGAGVVNLSLGGPAGAGDQFMADAIRTAGGLGAVVVAAAGNQGRDNDRTPTTPCTLPADNLICVAAVTQAGARASFSNYGATTVDVGAPGTSIVSARTDWGAPGLTESFEAGFDRWRTFTTGSRVWGPAIPPGGTRSATDSPGEQYESNAYSELRLDAGLDLAGERGCRMHFDLDHAIQPPDAGGYTDLFLAGAFVGSGPNPTDYLPFAGDSNGFIAAEVSISRADGRREVRPFFAVDSDASVVADGAYVDDVRVLCRDETYVDGEVSLGSYDQPGVGNYVAFSGTSMAAPHVAGIAALVRAVDPGAPPAEVVNAIRAGALPRASLAGRTVSGGVANASGAIAAALGPPAPPGVGGAGGAIGGEESVGGAAPQAVPEPVRALARALDLRGAASTLRAARSGRFTYRFKALPGSRGEAVFRTRKHGRAARRSFRSPASGTVRLRLKLSQRHLALLRRNRRLRLRVEVSAVDAQGRRTRAVRTLRLLAPR